MHEYSIVAALVEQVEASVRGQEGTVRLVRVKLGELSGVDPELLATAFETFREHTVCGAAELILERVPAAWSCPRCGEPIPRGAVLRCAKCDVPASLGGGDEILLERIELEVADV